MKNPAAAVPRSFCSTLRKPAGISGVRYSGSVLTYIGYKKTDQLNKKTVGVGCSSSSGMRACTCMYME